MLSDHYFVIDAEVKCDSADVAREETGVQMMSWTPRSLHSPSKADGRLRRWGPCLKNSVRRVTLVQRKSLIRGREVELVWRTY